MDPLPLPAPQPRLPLPPRPDRESQLLEAIRRRDTDATLRLCQSWVHRRGLAELEHFRLQKLSIGPDTGAEAWFEAVLIGSRQPRGEGETILLGAPAAAGESDLGLVNPVSSVQSDPPASINDDVDAAIAAMLASFPEEQLAELPPHQAFSVLETIPDPARLTSGSSLLERTEPPADLLADPLFQAGPAWPEPVDPPLRQPLSFRVDPRSSPASADAAPGALSSEGSDLDGPDPALVAEEAESNQPRLRRSLGRRFPGAARALRGALTGSLRGAARAGLAWLPSAAMPVEASEPDGPEEEGPEGGAFVWESDELAWDGEHSTSHGGFIASAPAETSRSLLPAAAEQGAAARLRQQLSLVDESSGEAALPAPRPSALAELGTWLPDRDLPRAS